MGMAIRGDAVEKIVVRDRGENGPATPQRVLARAAARLQRTAPGQHRLHLVHFGGACFIRVHALRQRQAMAQQKV